MKTTAHQPIRVFVSYSHKDWRHRDRLRTSLRGLKRRGLIEDWQDQDITPGNEWAESIYENLKAADIIILLVSPDFVDSDYAYYKEMQRALQRHERGEAVVIPVIVRPTDWEEEPFSKLEALPTKGRPIVKWSVRDDAWLDVTRGIRNAVEALALKRHRLNLSRSDASAIEHDVMDETKEASYPKPDSLPDKPEPRPQIEPYSQESLSRYERESKKPHDLPG
jgi:hypothetical protein